MNQPSHFQTIYSDFLTIFYQGRLNVELELVRTRISHIILNTTFPYICKHHEPFHIIKVCQEHFAKLAHCSFKTLGVLGGGGDFLTSFHAVSVCLGSTIIRPSYLKLRQAKIPWGKVHFFNPLWPEAENAKNQVTLNQSFQNYT